MQFLASAWWEVLEIPTQPSLLGNTRLNDIGGGPEGAYT